MIENFQHADGSISIPASLHEFGAPQKLNLRA
jgi:seryl-tRNA synthetase